MKVLHLLQSNRFSGAENVVCQIFGMAKNDPQLDMVYCSPDGQIRQALKKKNVPYVPLKRMKAAEVKRVIQEQKPDVIHAHDRSACVLAALTAKKQRIVAHMHVNNNKGFKTWLKNCLWTLLSFRYSHIFWVSDSSYEQFPFHRILKHKSTVLYNVIDIKALENRAKEDTAEYDHDIVYVGRLTYQKHPERLMEVLHKVVQKDKNIKAVIAGTGEYAEFVSRYIAENGLEGNIQYLGYCNNPAKLIQSAKVMVMTSRFEGTPMVALEAQSLGVPIVSTPVDGLQAIIENDCNGYLTEVDALLVEHMERIVSDTVLYTRLRENSLTKARAYNDMEKFFDAIAQAYGLKIKNKEMDRNV